MFLIPLQTQNFNFSTGQLSCGILFCHSLNYWQIFYGQFIFCSNFLFLLFSWQSATNYCSVICCLSSFFGFYYCFLINSLRICALAFLLLDSKALHFDKDLLMMDLTSKKIVYCSNLNCSLISYGYSLKATYGQLKYSLGFQSGIELKFSFNIKIKLCYLLICFKFCLLIQDLLKNQVFLVVAEIQYTIMVSKIKVYKLEKQKMGQNLRAIQQIVTNLENQQLITTQQAEQFMSDYENNAEGTRCVKQFMQAPKLTDFLKYYINSKYARRSKYPSDRVADSFLSSVQCPTRQQIQAELQSLAQSEIKQKIAQHYKNIENLVRKGMKRICDVVIVEYAWYSRRSIIKQLLTSMMKISQFQIINKLQNDLSIYDSSIDHISFTNSKDNLNMDNQTKTLISKGIQKITKDGFNLSSSSHKNTHYLILNQKNNKTENIQNCYIFKFRTALKFQMQNLQNVLRNNKNFRSAFSDVIIKLMKLLNHNIYQFCQPQIEVLATICQIAFSIIQLGVKLEEYSAKKMISNLLANQQILAVDDGRSLEDIILLLCGEQDEQKECLFNKKQILKQTKKSSKKLTNWLKALKTYRQLIETKQQFLDFDKYSQLKFCFIESRNPIIRKLKSCYTQNRTQIIDILSQHQNILSKIRQVTKNGYQPGIIEQQNESFIFQIHVAENSIIQRLLVLFKAKNVGTQIQQIDENSESFLQREKENKHTTSKIQEKIVKDLEKQDPNLKITGWLKLFIKQPLQLEEPNIEKEQTKWSVTDIQRVEGVDHNLNILALSEKQLTPIIWNIMKTNSLFNSLVNDKETSLKFQNFINELRHQYSINKNKFHNFHHAVNVMHMCCLLVNQSKIQDYLTHCQVLSVLLSGLCHDVGHTGFSNSYEIATFSQKAIVYNDNSPLQNYQASKTIQLIKSKQNNFLDKVQRQKWMLFKQNLINNILATDINQHFSVLSKFSQWKKLSKDQAKKQSNALTAMIVHTSDFAGSVKQFSIAKQWSHRLNSQFMNQEENYKKLGIRNSQNAPTSFSMRTMAINEHSYLKVIILPLYQQISTFCQKSKSINSFVQVITKNLNQWEMISNKQEPLD